MRERGREIERDREGERERREREGETEREEREREEREGETERERERGKREERERERCPASRTLWCLSEERSHSAPTVYSFLQTLAPRSATTCRLCNTSTTPQNRQGLNTGTSTHSQCLRNTCSCWVQMHRGCILRRGTARDHAMVSAAARSAWQTTTCGVVTAY